MTLKGFIFDFDGLILDTEIPGCNAWQELFFENGFSFTHEDWKKAIGTGPSAYDPAEHLSQLTNRRLDPKLLQEQTIVRAKEIIATQPLLPGVLEFIHTSREIGIVLAVASSSGYSWVEDHLTRVGLISYFNVVCTADDVKKVKPDPELYLLALEKLGITPSEAIVFEDSPNGITAAKAAGIYCIAVPNEITITMDISHADSIVESFLALDPNKLFAQQGLNCENDIL
ncbi:MAG: HAD-superfamily hydrolase [Chloroflexi bacterium]|nr:MAG: HAD-superfamily hydrolase [Chloroflexota bacterium]